MARVRIDTMEQPGGRTGHNVTVSAHLGCRVFGFTVPYTPDDGAVGDPHRGAALMMVTRLMSSRHRVFTKNEHVDVYPADPHTTGRVTHWIAESSHTP